MWDFQLMTMEFSKGGGQTYKLVHNSVKLPLVQDMFFSTTRQRVLQLQSWHAIILHEQGKVEGLQPHFTTVDRATRGLERL